MLKNLALRLALVIALIASLASMAVAAAPAQWNYVTGGSPQATFPGNISTPSINGQCWVDGTHYATLTAALAGCAANATIVIPANQSVTTALTVGAGTSIECVNNASIALTGSGNLILSGTNVVRNCASTGTSYRFTLNGPNISFVGNTFNSTAIQIGSSATDISHLYVNGNRFTGDSFGSPGVFLHTAATQNYITITDNFVSNGIYMYPQTATVMHDVVIANNITTMNDNGYTASGACIALLGVQGKVLNAVVANNTCTLEANGTAAGSNAYELGGESYLSVASNVYNANGFTLDAGDPIEVNSGDHIAVIGNVIEHGTFGGIAIEGVSHAIVSGNIGDGSTNQGVLVTSTSFAGQNNINDIVVTNNDLDVSANGAFGVLVQCGTGVSCGDIVVGENNIKGIGTLTGTIGVFAQPNSGTLSNIQIGPNAIDNIIIGVDVGSGVTNDCLVAGANYATTAIVNNGAASACH